MVKLYRKKVGLALLILILTQVQVGSYLLQAATVTPKLTLTAAMSMIPSDGRPHPAVYIGLDNGQGKPYASSQPIKVTLSASDNDSINIPASVTIPPASSSYVVNASSIAVGTKQIELTASSSGFVSATLNVAVGPPAGAPTSLDVTVLPSVLLPVVGATADLVVTLVDSYGNPTPARSNLNVALISSDPNTADVPSGTIVILEGSMTAKTTLVSTGRDGSTTITASAPNLKSDTGTLIVAGPQPTKISIWCLSKLPAYDTSNVLFVGITDSGSNPVKLLSPKTITLYSSNSSVVSLQSTVTIAAGQWYAIVPLNCKLSLGTSTISAVSTDMVTATINIAGTTLSNSTATSLKLYPIATGFPADEANKDTLLVQRLDTQGNPTKSTSSLQIQFSSANTEVVEIAQYTTIQLGRSASLVTATTKLPGAAVITAGSPTTGTTTATLKSYAPVPDTVVIQTPPIPTEGEVEACLVTMSGSTPVPVSENTLFQFASSDTQVGKSDVDSLTLNAKVYMSYLKIIGSAPGQFSLTVSASGLPSSKITFKVLDTKPSTLKITSVKPVVNYEFPILIQMGNSGGVPSVSSDPSTINVVASNASIIRVPGNVIIDGDKTELVFYARALAEKQTSITFSSPGFKSTTIQLTPSASPCTAELRISSKMPMNKPSEAQFILKVSGQPVVGATGEWIGQGFTSKTLYTDSNGVAINTYTLMQDQEYIEAKALVGGGYVVAGKTITSVPDAYHLVVTTNVPITTAGSGTYSYGDKVIIEAPVTAPMPHILGLLGGKYVFVQWTGDKNTVINSFILSIEGDKTELRVEALYNSDYTMLFITVGLLVVLIVAGFFINRKYGKQIAAWVKNKLEKKDPSKPVVKPSPVKH